MDKADRTSYLQSSYGGDKELIAEMESLLSHSESEKLQRPLVQIQSSFVFAEDETLTDKRIGPYRLIRTISTGGMGHVYLAVRDDDQFERFVALKVIRKELVSEDLLSGFYEERQILASLNHPNIARLFDGGTTEDGIPWFAMEYIEGQPITEYCRLHNASTGQKIDLFLSVCGAVQYAHQNLVIHRDLKPANILITAGGAPKLLDFGIATLMDLEHNDGESEEQSRVMTPEYASPEQVRRDSISTISDVYSLGVLLYELLTGRLPYEFKERTPEAIKQTVCRKAPTSPSRVSGKVLDEDLVSIAMKALKKDPSERYGSVEQLSEDLRRYLKGLPVLAYEESLLYRSRKFIQRNKWGVAVAASVLLLVVTFSVITLVQSKAIQARAVEAEQQRDRAEQVSSFLAELFESADPSEAENKSLTAIELLHQGSERIETELSDRPGLQSNLYLVISDVYESLGMYDEGLDLSRKAYVLQKKLYMNTHPDIARSLNSMGWLYRQKGSYEKADSNLTAALAMRQELYGRDHLDVARSLNDLAVLKQSQGEYTATDTLLTEAIKIRKDLLGEQHESVAVALSNYAALKWRMGDLPAAEKRMQEALDIFLESVGEKDMRVAIAMTNLAAIRLTQKDITEVETLYRKALDIRLQLLGEEHPDVANSYAHLGNFLRAQQKYDESEELLRKALELRKNLLGREHLLVGDSKRVLGNLYENMQDYTEAESYYSDAIETFRKVFPEGHARTAEVLHTLGELYLHMKKPELAEQPLQEAMGLRKRFFGEHDGRTLDSMIKLGVCLADKGNIPEARLLLSRGLDLLKNSDSNPEELLQLAEVRLADL